MVVYGHLDEEKTYISGAKFFNQILKFLFKPVKYLCLKFLIRFFMPLQFMALFKGEMCHFYPLAVF